MLNEEKQTLPFHIFNIIAGDSLATYIVDALMAMALTEFIGIIQH